MMMFARIEDFRFKPRWLAWIANRALVGKYYSEERHPISRLMHRLYEGPCRFVVRHAKATLAVSALLVAYLGVLLVPLFVAIGFHFLRLSARVRGSTSSVP